MFGVLVGAAGGGVGVHVCCGGGVRAGFRASRFQSELLQPEVLDSVVQDYVEEENKHTLGCMSGYFGDERDGTLIALFIIRNDCKIKF